MGRAAGCWCDVSVELEGGEADEEAEGGEEDAMGGCDNAGAGGVEWAVDGCGVSESCAICWRVELSSVSAVLASGVAVLAVGGDWIGVLRVSALACPETTAMRCAFLARSLARSAAAFSARNAAADTAGVVLTDAADSALVSDMLRVGRGTPPGAHRQWQCKCERYWAEEQQALMRHNSAMACRVPW